MVLIRATNVVGVANSNVIAVLFAQRLPVGVARCFRGWKVSQSATRVNETSSSPFLMLLACSNQYAWENRVPRSGITSVYFLRARTLRAIRIIAPNPPPIRSAVLGSGVVAQGPP